MIKKFCTLKTVLFQLVYMYTYEGELSLGVSPKAKLGHNFTALLITCLHTHTLCIQVFPTCLLYSCCPPHVVTTQL